jgi:hypothetical protein
MARRTLILAAICALLTGTEVAHAQTGEQLSSSWAQTNVCNATQLGSRAQLAGDGTKSDLSVRFTAQWLSPSGWASLGGAATSPWQAAGSAEYTWGQAGWTFSISVPPGNQYQLRSVAELRWSGETNRSETHTTATCTIGG